MQDPTLGSTYALSATVGSAANQESSSRGARPNFPPVVYVPTSGEDDPVLRRVLMHEVQDGRTALYTYSAIDRLHQYYLPDSSWVLCDGATLQRIHDETPYDLLFLDVDPGFGDREGEG